MKLVNGLRTSLLVALATQMAVPMLPMVAHAQTASNVAVSKADVAALTDAQRLTLNMLILTTIVDQKVGDLVAVDPAIAKKYQVIRATYLGAVPAASVGAGALYLGKESSDKVESIMQPLTAALRASGQAVNWSGERIEAFSKITGLDYVLRQSSTASANLVSEVIVPILKIFITKETALSSAAVGSSGVFAGSMFFMMNDSNEAMSWEMVRNVLGQDEVVRARIDKLVANMSQIFDLEPSAQAKLKQAIYDDAMKQAVANKFSPDSSRYALDVLSIMKANGIIGEDTAQAVLKLRKLASGISSADMNRTEVKLLVAENVDAALGLAAVLESQLNAGKISDARTRAEVERMLGSLTSKLMLIGFNLKK